jgi:hypothetical protein
MVLNNSFPEMNKLLSGRIPRGDRWQYVWDSDKITERLVLYLS